MGIYYENTFVMMLKGCAGKETVRLMVNVRAKEACLPLSTCSLTMVGRLFVSKAPSH